jgi:hypothetical protein
MVRVASRVPSCIFRTQLLPGTKSHAWTSIRVDALVPDRRCPGEASPQHGQGRQAVAVTVEDVDRCLDVSDIEWPLAAGGLTVEPPADFPPTGGGSGVFGYGA